MVAAAITGGKHRDFIGGMWEAIGQLQSDFLIGAGLEPHHYFIDIGSGVFRAGVRLIPCLEPGHYYAIDINQALLDTGYEREIVPAGLAQRFPRANMAASTDFDIGGFGRVFDYGMAQSVFSHLPLRYLPICLSRIAPHFRRGGVFFVTFFHVSDGQEHAPFRQPHGFLTFHDRDLYHYSYREVKQCAAATEDWHLDIIGNWNHPRYQQMLAFTRR